MSGRSPILYTFVRDFFKSLIPRRRQRQLVGEDYYGTKYYERKFPEDSNRRNRPERYFVPVNKDDFTQDIPAEWEAWLRHRRSVPPTPEEVNQNYKRAMLTKKNAMEIESAYKKEKAGILESNVPSERMQRTKFPIYEDYQNKKPS